MRDPPDELEQAAREVMDEADDETVEAFENPRHIDHEEARTELLNAMVRKGSITFALDSMYDKDNYLHALEYAANHTEDGTRLERGHPVINEDGERLAFKNQKSGSETIHIAREDDPREAGKRLKGWTSYTWSVCGMGATRRGDPIYLSPDEVEEEYITRDGEVVGKLCGNCRNALTGSPFDRGDDGD